MVQRKKIPKRIRFEVFKRDKFTCQYCGRSAPQVVLEIDHIKPVSKGGTNDMLNLVTSCVECNRGKTNKELSDDSAVLIQQKQLIDLQEKREQMEMIVKWKEELLEAELEMTDACARLIEKLTGYGINNNGRKDIRILIQKFGFDEVYTAIQISFNRYAFDTESQWHNAFNKIGGICYNRMKQRSEHAEQNT